MKLSICLLAFAVLLGSATAIGPQGRALLQDNDNDDDNNSPDCRSPVQTLARYPQTFSNLTAAIQAAGLTGYLNSTQNQIGIFAPTNGAFGRLAAQMNMTVAQLAQNANLVRAVLLYHVIADNDEINELSGDRMGNENTFLGPNLNITAVRTQNPQNVTRPASAPSALPPAMPASSGRKLLQDNDNDDDSSNDNDNDNDNTNNDDNDNDDDNDNNPNNNMISNRRLEDGNDSDRNRALYLVSGAGSIARVTVANLDACEATVHVVDTVLIPPTPFLSAPVAVTMPDANTVRVVSGPTNSPICTSTVTRGAPMEDNDDLRVMDNCPNMG